MYFTPACISSTGAIYILMNDYSCMFAREMIIHVCVSEIRICTSYTFDTSHAESALLYILHTSCTLHTLHPCLYSQYRVYCYTCEFVLVIGLFMTIFMCKCECLILRMTIDIGWRRLIGSPKLQIHFHKRATKYRSLLRKMTYKDKGSYESWPPCMHHSYICEWGMSWPMWIRYVNEVCDSGHMTDSTENTTPPKSTTSKNSNSPEQIQNKPKSHLEFVPRDTERSEVLKLVDCGSVAISVKTVICAWGTS